MGEMLQPVLAAMLLVGCAAPAPGPGRPGPGGGLPDTGDPVDPPPCGEGEHLEDGQCLPERCGEGPWGLLDTASFDRFVRPGAAPGGDGSIGAPFGDLLVAVADVDGRGRIAIDGGTLDGSVVLEYVEDVEIVGRCPEALRLVGGEGDAGGDPSFKLFAPGGTATLSGVTITGGGSGGVFASQGALILDTVDVVRVPRFGILAIGEDDPLVLRSVRVAESPGVAAEEGGGAAIYATPGTRIEGSDITIERGNGRGIVALGGDVELERVRVDGVREGGDRESVGLMSMVGGRIVCRECTVVDTDGYGVRATDAGDRPSTVVVEDGHIEGILGFATDEGIATGAHAVSGGRVELRRVSFADVRGNAVTATFEGSVVVAEELDIQDVRAPEDLGEGGVAALFADRGGRVEASGVAVRDVSGWAGVSDGEGSELDVSGLLSTGIGVDVPVGAGGELTDAAVLGGGVGVARGGAASIADSTLERSLGAALVVADGDLALHRVQVLGVQPTLLTTDGATAGAGLLAGSGARVSGSDATIDGAVGMAVVARDARLEISGLEVRETGPSDGEALAQDLLLTGATAGILSDLELVGGASNGLWLEGEGADLRVEDATLGVAQGAGLVALDGARLLVAGVVAEGRTGVGLAAAGAGTELSVERAELGDTRDGTLARYAVGVGAFDGAIVSMEQVEVRDTAGAGLVVRDAALSCHDCAVLRAEGVAAYALGGALSLADSSIEDTLGVDRVGGFGVFGDDATVDLLRTTVSVHPTVAAWVRGPDSDWTITDAVLSGGEPWTWSGTRTVHGDALVVTGGVQAEQVRVSTSALQGAGGVGLLLDGSGARLDGVSFVDNALDLRLQGCGVSTAAVPGALPPSATMDVCPAGGDPLRLEPDLAFFVELGAVLSE